MVLWTMNFGTRGAGKCTCIALSIKEKKKSLLFRERECQVIPLQKNIRTGMHCNAGGTFRLARYFFRAA